MKTTLYVTLGALITGVILTTTLTPQLSLLTNLTILLSISAAASLSMILSYGMKDIKTLKNNIWGIIKAPELKPEDIITQISGVQKLAKQNDLELVERKDFHPFIVDGVKHMLFLQDSWQVKDTMNHDIGERKNRHAHDLTKLITIGKLPIQLAFVISLVMALPLFFETQSNANLARLFTMPIVTIVNGFLLSHFGIQPITNRIHHIFNKDIEVRKMIARGINLIAQDRFPQDVEHALKVHVKPSRRAGHFEFELEMSEPPELPEPVKEKETTK